MQRYVINLTRRPDRLAAMTRQFARMELDFVRVDALDVRTAARAELTAGFDMHTQPCVMDGDMACSQSHRRAWRTFLSTGETHAVFLEDDVIFTAEGPEYLTHDAWIPDGVDVIKLELTGPLHRYVLVRNLVTLQNGHRIGQLCSRHAGAGAYVLSRRGAEILLRCDDWRIPVDQMLFNPDRSPVYRAIRPNQLLPAIARQPDEELRRSDLIGERLRRRRNHKTLFHRLRRFYAECHQMPQQIAALLRGGRFVQPCPSEAFAPAPAPVLAPRHT